MSSMRQDLLLDSNLFVDDDSVAEEVEENGHAKDKDTGGHKHKRKRNKRASKKQASKSGNGFVANSSGETDKENEESQEAIEIELVPETIELDKNYEEFARVFEHFKVGSVAGCSGERLVLTWLFFGVASSTMRKRRAKRRR